VSKGTSNRYTYFRFVQDSKLEIVVPRGRHVDIDYVIRSRIDWIRRRYEQLTVNTKVFDGRSVMYDGQRLPILFEKSEHEENLIPDMVGGRVFVRTSESSRILELVRRWFVRDTSRYVVRKLSEISGRIPAKYKRADVRQMKSWGYCTRDGRLAFSWQLIALPEALREYVIMHELSHLKQFDHSKEFKKVLASMCPDYRARERALNKIIPGSLADYLD